jgi:hypothetical protein
MSFLSGNWKEVKRILAEMEFSGIGNCGGLD